MIPEERRQLVIEKFLEGVERKKIAAYYSMPYSTVNHIIAEYMKGKHIRFFIKNVTSVARNSKHLMQKNAGVATAVLTTLGIKDSLRILK